MADKIYKVELPDGTQYDLGGSGGGSANIVELTQAEYNALPDSKFTDSVAYFIKDGAPVPSYSTEEHVIGTWVNDKPVYRLVVTNSSIGQVSINIANLAIDDLIYMDGYIISDSGAGMCSCYATSNRSLYITSNKDTIVYYTTSGTDYLKYAIIEYTKKRVYPDDAFVEKYRVHTTSTSTSGAYVEIINLLTGESRNIRHDEAISESLVYDCFTFKYIGDNRYVWCLTITADAAKIDDEQVNAGYTKLWSYNSTVDFIIKVLKEG